MTEAFIVDGVRMRPYASALASAYRSRPKRHRKQKTGGNHD